MSCHRCHSSPCSCHRNCDDCSCPQQIKGTCVFYQGANLSCIDATKGDTSDEIFAKIDAIVCDLIPPSGIFTTITTCSEDITVTMTTPSGIPNYRLCLNDTFVEQVDSNTADILVLQNCLGDSVIDIVSDTLAVTTESTEVCGKTLRLEIITPSGLPSYDGIIYNDNSKVGTSGSTGDKVLKQFTHNYTFSNALAHDDEIRFRTNGEVLGDGSEVDDVKIELFDSTSAIVLHTATFTGFPVGVISSSWQAEGVLSATSIAGGTGVYTLNFLLSNKANGVNTSVSSAAAVVNADVSGIDFTNLTIRVIYVHNSTTVAANNFARQLMVEVRKKI